MVQLRMSPGTPDYARHRQLLVRWQVTRLLQRCLLDAPLPLSHRAQQGKRLACTIGQGSQRSAPQSHCWIHGPASWLEHRAGHSKCSSIPYLPIQMAGVWLHETGSHRPASAGLNCAAWHGARAPHKPEPNLGPPLCFCCCFVLLHTNPLLHHRYDHPSAVPCTTMSHPQPLKAPCWMETVKAEPFCLDCEPHGSP